MSPEVNQEDENAPVQALKKALEDAQNQSMQDKDYERCVKIGTAISKLSEIELQSKPIGMVMSEILLELESRRRISVMLEETIRSFESLDRDITNHLKWLESQRDGTVCGTVVTSSLTCFHVLFIFAALQEYLGLLIGGVGKTQNRTAVKRLANRRGISLTPDNIVQVLNLWACLRTAFS